MQEMDVWFTRINGNTYLSLAEHDEAPTAPLRRVENVAVALSRLRSVGQNIVQVGIASPEMLG